MSDLIKIANGSVDAIDLDSTFLVINFTRQTDMKSGDAWLASQPEFGVEAELVNSIELGSGDFYGGVSGIISFHILTEDMRQFIRSTVLGGSPISIVTVSLHDPQLGQTIYEGELVSPFATNRAASYVRFDEAYYYNVEYLFRNGQVRTVSNLLLETGDVILAENGDTLALEQQ